MGDFIPIFNGKSPLNLKENQEFTLLFSLGIGALTLLGVILAGRLPPPPIRGSGSIN